jgi:hypothetical protein
MGCGDKKCIPNFGQETSWKPLEDKKEMGRKHEMIFGKQAVRERNTERD